MVCVTMGVNDIIYLGWIYPFFQQISQEFPSTGLKSTPASGIYEYFALTFLN
jgi:hypothetical protein